MEEATYYKAKERDEQEFNGFLHTLLNRVLNKQDEMDKKGVLLLCIGTDRMLGDTLGPLTGYMLESTDLQYVKVIGNVNNPVHALNLAHYKKLISQDYADHLVIALDASLGKEEDIGCLAFRNGGLTPGAGSGNDRNGEIGDLSITGVVGEVSASLYSIRLSRTLELVEYVVDVIKQLDDRLYMYSKEKESL